MSEREFCNWLHGYFEIGYDQCSLSGTQVEIIKDHLKLVFEKITPSHDLHIAPSSLPDRRYC